MNVQPETTPNPSVGPLSFPQLTYFKLTGFSLYSQAPNLELVVPKGVFCLAGANGLGKSTFLTTLNYALTGIVMDPSRELSKSIEEYFRDTRDFSKQYYSGRIAQEDREAATVELRFSVGSSRYRIVRGFFEPSELRSLEVTYQESERKRENIVLVDGDEAVTAAERDQKYKRLLTQDVGVRSFDQFAFLQHFVLTFDESRRLLFWHQQALEQALFLAFGPDYEGAEIAETLRREVDRQDSIARNYNWRATGIRNQIDVLTDAINGAEPPTSEELALDEMHKELQEDSVRHRRSLELKEAEVNDAELKVMRLSAERTSLEAEYAREFGERVQRRSRVELHPLVRNSLDTSECSVCGSAGAHVISHIQERLDKSKCPLCESPIQAELGDSDTAERLREVDEELEQTRHRLSEAQRAYERLRNERHVVAQQLEAIEEHQRRFEAANAETLERITDHPTSVQQKITSLNDLLKEHILIKDQALEQRNKARNRLKQYQRTVQLKYIASEEKFVPMFRDLAYEFLGIDLDVTLQASGAMYGGLSLAVELRSSMRRQAYQLSESQRFFLDIALRMALARYMSEKDSTASMVIDTPEGSLDIAYESRAGKMFARFVESGHNLIMTANINTSQLLIRLAEECGNARMKLQRMTSWAELSDVQVEEESLFADAFEEIEAALARGVDASRL